MPSPPPNNSFPLLHTLILCLCKVSEASVICFIMPFVNEMVAGFGKDQTTSARYAGVIESALVCTEAIFSPVWGYLADRYGRKHLLVLGLAAFSVACVAIGLSRSLWAAVASRCISGVLGAVSVLVRTVQFEIADSGAQMDKVLEFMTPCWAVGATIGPLIGGLLANPARTMPSIFDNHFWNTYPYLLPSLVTAVLPATGAIMCWIWLPETLGRPTAEPSAEGSTPVIIPSSPRGTETSTLVSNSPASSVIDLEFECAHDLSLFHLLSNKSLAYSLFVSALIAFISMAYNAGFIMMASASVADGGLGLSTVHLGFMLAGSSLLGVLTAGYVVPPLVQRFGWYGSLRITSFGHVLLFPLIGFAGFIAKFEDGVGPYTGFVLVLVLICYEVAETSFTGVDVAIADRAPPGCLARVNGLSASCASLGRMLAPTLSGLLWSSSLQMKDTIGHYLIWFIFTFLAIIWWISTLRLHSTDERAARKKVVSLEKISKMSAPDEETGLMRWTKSVTMDGPASYEAVDYGDSRDITRVNSLERF